MASQPWFDELSKRLRHQGLPPDYVRRLVGELFDHFQDLKEETMNTDVAACARLGEIEHVARVVTTAYRQRSFIGRHAWAAFLVFAVSPVAMSILLMPVMFGAAYWLGRGLGYWDASGLHLGAFGRALLPYGLAASAIVLPTAILSLVYARVARRTGMGNRWLAASCAVLAIFAAGTYCEVLLDLTGHGRLVVGLGPQSFLQLAQPILPLALGWWFVRRRRAEAQVPAAS